MNPPRITVVTPSYEQAPFLEATIGSVLGQDYGNLEYIVVDGGSRDGSADIIRRHADHLTWWCSESDGGQAHAINKGFRRATGDVVGWLNSDDLLLPGAARRIAAAFRDPAVKAICSWGILVTEDGRIKRKETFPQPTTEVLLRRAVLFQQSFYWRRELLDEIGYLDESKRFCMDLEYWVRLVRHGIVPRLVPSFLAAFRRHTAQKTKVINEVGQREAAEVFEQVHGPAGRDVRALERTVPWDWRLRFRLLQWYFRGVGAFLPPWPRGRRLPAAGRDRSAPGPASEPGPPPAPAGPAS